MNCSYPPRIKLYVVAMMPFVKWPRVSIFRVELSIEHSYFSNNVMKINVFVVDHRMLLSQHVFILHVDRKVPNERLKVKAKNFPSEKIRSSTQKFVPYQRVHQRRTLVDVSNKSFKVFRMPIDQNRSILRIWW